MNTEGETADREPLPGESEYVQARQMTRHVIPEFSTDGEYLALLGKSAAQGFPRALMKLGEYAMRRETVVEAFYWLWRARRSGVQGLDLPLQKLRWKWAMSGFPSEAFNRNELFTDAQASVALALLDLASGRNREAALEFLGLHFPELVDA